MKIVDLHSDTMLGCWDGSLSSLRKNNGHIDLEKLKKGGSLCQFFALYIDWPDYKDLSPYEIYCGMLETFKREMSSNADVISQVYNYSDIVKNEAEGKLSALLAIEDGACFEGRIERVQQAYDQGVRHVGIMWNFENEIGFPCSADDVLHGKGLKKFGFEVIEEMSRLGMIVDLSHSSKGVFMNVAAMKKMPLVASHSCARALRNHQRNLDDEQLKLLGESGGVMGLNYEGMFLNENCNPFTYDRAIVHMKHIIDKAGIESLAFGSDSDGLKTLGEMGDFSNYPVFIERMENHFTGREIDLISHGNALRLIRDVLK